jgi:hypothetical protein
MGLCGEQAVCFDTQQFGPCLLGGYRIIVA